MSVIPGRLITLGLRTRTQLFRKRLLYETHCCGLATKPELKQNNFITNPATSHRYVYNIAASGKLQFSTSAHNTDKHPKNDKIEEKKLSLFQRFKQMYRDYWYVLVPVHLITSAGWFGGFYYLASSGVDIPSLLECLNVSESIISSMKKSNMGYFAITYGLYKIATPLRYTVTLGGTTISINYLKKWGYIKPMPSKERLKEIYSETKEGMKERKENIIETVQNIQQTVKDTKEGIKETKDNIVSSVKESKQSIKNIKEKVIGRSAHKDQDKS